MKVRKIAILLLVVGIVVAIGSTAIVKSLNPVEKADGETSLSVPAGISCSGELKMNNANENAPPFASSSEEMTPNGKHSAKANSEAVEQMEKDEDAEGNFECPLISGWPSLPAEYVTLQVANGVDSYFISTLSGVPSGFDVANDVYPGWCVDKRFDIPRDTDLQVMLYSSLEPPTGLESQRWDLVNYILNHKQGSMQDVQDAIWYFVKMDGVGWWSDPKVGAQGMIDDALANGDGFTPVSGEVLAVICLPETETQITIIELVVPGCEGLTPGFWKNHPDVWVGYMPDDSFFDVFGVQVTINAGSKNENSDPTLLEALMAKGGVVEEKGVYDALVRHAVAALLNAAHPDVAYPMTEQSIIDAVKEAIENSDLTDAEPLKNMLDAYNNMGGGIDAHGNPL